MDRLQIAREIIDLARAQVLAENHFLSAAVGRLGLEPAVLGDKFATNGRTLFFDASRVIVGFKAHGLPPQHDLLHSVVHCLFLHMYVGPSIHQYLWNIACDMACERAAADLIGPRAGDRGVQAIALFTRIERELGCRPSVEKIYNRLRDGMWEDELGSWRDIVHADDHTAWYTFHDSHDPSTDDDLAGASGRGSFQIEGDAISGGVDSKTAGAQGDATNDLENGPSSSGQDFSKSQENDVSNERNKTQASYKNESSPSGSSQNKKGQGDTAGSFVSQACADESGLAIRTLVQAQIKQEMEQWRRVATSLSVNLQTMSARRGRQTTGFIGDLKVASKHREDYASFLRQFAIMGEVMRVSEDEFDNIFYTYGMSLYGNLPLVEPLEYREEKRVREFVIVIDTSGSVSGETVKHFVETTFGILHSSEAFFENVHVRIIQCDAAVQSDDRVSSLAQLAEWGSSMKVLGCGGTDFRPAFEYVDALVDAGEFANLGGLVYFTDGCGTYPDWMPGYKTAFVFYDEDYRSEEVPPWTVQMTLDADSLRECASEYIKGGSIHEY